MVSVSDLKAKLTGIEAQPDDRSLWEALTVAGVQWALARLDHDGELALDLKGNAGAGHWYCDRGRRLARPTSPSAEAEVVSPEDHEAINTFLVQAVGYRAKGDILRWRQQWSLCLNRCVDCAIGYEKAERVLTSKWLPLRLGKDIARYCEALDKALFAVLAQGLEEAGIVMEQPIANMPATLDAVPPAVLVSILLRPRFLHTFALEPFLVSAAARTFQPTPSLRRVPLPGLAKLALSDESSIWARSQFADAALPSWDPWLRACLEITVEAIQSPSSSDQTRDLAWASLEALISHCSAELATLAVKARVGSLSQSLFQLVCTHVADTTSLLSHVLGCFAAILRKVGSECWKEETKDWIGVVLANILDNRAFERMVEELGEPGISDSDSLPSVFAWMPAFVSTQVEASEGIFTSFVNQLVVVLLERLQKPRFPLCSRLIAVQAAVRVLEVACCPPASTGSKNENDIVEVRPRPAAAQCRAQILDLCAPMLITIAFGRDYAADEWNSVRAAVIRLLERVANEDSRKLATTVRQLSIIRSQAVTAKAPPQNLSQVELRLSKIFWTQLYDICDTRPDGLRVLIRSLRGVAHLVRLSSVSWLPSDKPYLASLRPVCKNVNDFLGVATGPLAGRLESFINSPHGLASLSSLMEAPGAVEGMIALVYSPRDDIYSMALTLIREWGDCDSRLDCFKVLFQRNARAAAGGLLQALRQAVSSIQMLPDAIGIAKRLVRCTTDVLETICSATGLLRSTEARSLLPPKFALNLWTVMVQALAEIFDRTPSWAEFSATEQMTDWMRDGLIFAERTLEQVGTFEAATTDDLSRSTSALPQRATGSLAAIVDAFVPTIKALLKWLRLTEPDLLDRATAVLTRMLERFAKFERPLDRDIVEKLGRYIRRTGAPRAKDQSVILTPRQCGAIGKALASHPLLEGFSDFGDDDFVFESSEVQRKPGRSEAQPAASQSLGLYGNGKLVPNAKGFGGKSLGTTTHKSGNWARYGQSSVVQSIRKELGKNKSSAPPPRMPVERKVTVKTIQISGSSDEDSEDTDKGLAALAKVQKPAAVRKMTERRKIQLFDEQSRQRVLQQQAAAQRQAEMRAQRLRMKPDYTMLHQHILQWRYDHTGEAPPGYSTKLDRVPSRFDSHREYIQALEPLLMCECWQQIMRAKEDVANGEKMPIPCEIAGRASVDSFTEVETTVKFGLMPEGVYLTESDLVLLRSGHRHILARVLSSHRKQNAFEIGLRISLANDVHGVGGVLVPRTKWEIIPLCNLSTVHREWAALRSLPYLTLAEDILDSRLSPPAPVSDSDLTRIMQLRNVNEPQGRAILSSLKTLGLSLIQGPPGTGKTSTIVGLIGEFIATRSDTSNGIVKKILLAAPSNAAVDEVVKRLRIGLPNAKGETIFPRVVRIGAEGKIDAAVKDVFLDALVNARLSGSDATASATGASSAASDIQTLLQQIRDLKDQRTVKVAEAAAVQQNPTLARSIQDEIGAIRRKLNEISQKLDEARDRQSASRRTLDAVTVKMRAQIIEEADVVCATLSSSGHQYLSQCPFDFETVVIDEACQCVEPAALIPLRYNAQQLILVGDPNQLAATVLSQLALRSGYDQSLFLRAQTHRPDAVHLLSIQYRMHSEISAFPSAAFYASKVLNGPDVDTKTTQPWHRCSLFPPYRFFQARGAREELGRHHSYLNRGEAAIAVAIYARLLADHPDYDFENKVGVITGYSAQVSELKRQFRQRFGQDVLSRVDINTADGFQGSERFVMILSCVRGGTSSESGGIGFLKDRRRVNVALTRAKSSLFIIGDPVALSRDELWASLIEDARERDLFMPVDASTFKAPAPIRVVKAKTSPVRARSKITAAARIQPAMPVFTPKALAARSQAKVKAASSIPGLLVNQSAPILDQDATTEVATTQKRGPNEERGEAAQTMKKPRLDIGDEATIPADPRASGLGAPAQAPTIDQALPVAVANPLASATTERGAGRNAGQQPAKGPKAPSLFIPKKRAPLPAGRSGPSHRGARGTSQGQGDGRGVKQRLMEQWGGGTSG